MVVGANSFHTKTYEYTHTHIHTHMHTHTNTHTHTLCTLCILCIPHVVFKIIFGHGVKRLVRNRHLITIGGAAVMVISYKPAKEERERECVCVCV